MKKRCLVLWGTILLLCLAACGRSEQESVEVQENTAVQEDFSTAQDMSSQEETLPDDEKTLENSGQESGMSEEERREYDWRTEDWKLDEAGENGHKLYAAEYINDLKSVYTGEYEECRSSYCIMGGRIYSLDKYYNVEEGEKEQLFYLNCYDSFTGEIWHRSLELPQLPELEAYDDYIVYLNGFEIQSEQELVIFLHVRAKGEKRDTLAYLAVHTSMEGEFISALDLYPAMLAGGVVDYTGERITERSGYSPGDVYLDREGFYYMRLIRWDVNDQERQGGFVSDIYILNPAGTQVGVMKPYQGHSPSFAMKTPDGEPVFRWYTGTGINSGALMYYDKEAQEPKQLLKLRENLWGANYWVGTMSEDGYLFFMDKSGRLNRCDLSTGKREYCLGYGSLGLGDWPGMVDMALGPDREPIFLDTYEDYTICRLGTEAPETDPIRLVSLTDSCTFIENVAQRFTKRHLDHPIEVEKPGEDQEAYRTRMMAELVSGKGADIYYVSAADMQILYENGVLADLSGALPAQVEEAVYPGVLDGGMRGSQRVGIAPEARAVTMMVSGKYWDGENWKLEALLDMVDAHPELTYPIIWGQQYLGGQRLLQILLFQDMDNTPFLDLKSGSCDFENPLFIRLLELAKRYYDRPIEISGERNMPQELLEEGDYVAVVLSPRDFPEFNRIMSFLPKDCHQVGIPTDEGTGCYWQTDYYLVVNKDAVYPELIHEYLAYLLEEENQDRTLQPVRRDMLDKHIVADSTDNTMQYSDSQGGYYFLEIGADGTVWQEEYEQMQSRSVLVTKDTGYIQQIITEETESYFTGVRDAEAVAGLIQNRVQLYLKEQGTAEENGAGKGGQTGVRHFAG